MKKRIISLIAALSFSAFTLAAPLSASADNINIGDTDLDGEISISDAALILDFYSKNAAGMEASIDAAADVDSDNSITIADASYVLTYYSETAAGMSPTWERILGISTKPDVTVSMDGLNSQYACLIDAESGEVIAEKNGYDKVYPASMTKIMTAIVTIENVPDIGAEITVPAEAVNTAAKLGGSKAGFKGGEKITWLDLLYGMLLPSGCECTIAAALLICGSESAFADLMNEKAAELGMTGTHYANSTGLPIDTNYNTITNHYTTAYDMTILMRYAIQNDIFRMVDTTKSYTASNGLSMKSTMFSTLTNYFGNANVTGGAILGGKTGTTNAAGRCLCSFAEIYGREYILCTTKASASGKNAADAKTVYNRLGKALS